MSQFLNRLLEKTHMLFSKAKTILTKDYSTQDLRNFPSRLKLWWKNVSFRLGGVATGALQNQEDVPTKTVTNVNRRLDVKGALQIAQQALMNQRKALLWVGMLLVLVLIYWLVLAPFGLKVERQIEMRPAQWSQLQNLIRVSKINAADMGSTTSMSLSATVSILDEQELQKILNTFNARGIKPSVFRLNTDNPPHIEFQMSEVMFSVFLDALEELRTTWRLYPTQLSVVSDGGAGIVSISGVFSQYGSHATDSRESGGLQ